MAVTEVQVFQLGVGTQFARLTGRDQRYAHRMARAAWHGTRIILRQVSQEAIPIFDFILELYTSCSGDWEELLELGIGRDSLRGFLVYAATFLSNVGNYYGSGDQKFIPCVDEDILRQLSTRSPLLETLYAEISEATHSIPPYSLGYPSESTQSAYYLGGDIREDEIALVSRALEQNSIFPENTRVSRAADGSGLAVLLASVETSGLGEISLPDGGGTVKLLRGDHSDELRKICAELSEAKGFAASHLQGRVLDAYIESFVSGSLDKYRDSQRLWVQGKGPRVENIFGFVEPYRDPHGIRSEFEGLVAIADDAETRFLARLVEDSVKFIRRLPWASAENDGKGAFEKSLFEPPDFSSIHSLAYCSSIIFPGINLPNYNDIRQQTGFKNVIISNRMATEAHAKQYSFIPASEAEAFRKHKFPAYYWWVVLHELLGHGTGKMMVEETPGTYNFDQENPPISPLTGEPIETRYKYGQTWTGQFADLATTVDECRAELVGAYLLDDEELLELLGFGGGSNITGSDVTYNMYQQLGVDGLRGLANFNTGSDAHSRAHFAILRCLLLNGKGFMRIVHDKSKDTLTVHVDKDRIVSDGKPALGEMLLRLHMYRSTADVGACREYYEMLSHVDGEYLEWRETVVANKPPPMIFAHANTFLDGDKVVLKEYAATVEGVIESWANRKV